MIHLVSTIILAGLLLAPVCSAQPPVTRTFKKAGSLEIKADIYMPAAGTGLRPAIFWIHGGALISGHRGGIRAWQRERYLGEGFAVVSVDYRLAPETKLPEIVGDVEDAWKWLQREGRGLGIDPRRVAVVGHSAGGYLTLTMGHRAKPRPRALVPFYGYGDITGDWYAKPDPFYSTSQKTVPREEALAKVGREPLAGAPGPSERGRYYLYLRQNGLWPKEVGGWDPVTERAKFDPWSPLRNVTRKYPPTLLLHGDADTDVPFAQSEAIAAELARHGVEHELVRIKDGPHGFDAKRGDPQVAAAFDKVIAFLKRWLQ